MGQGSFTATYLWVQSDPETKTKKDLDIFSFSAPKCDGLVVARCKQKQVHLHLPAYKDIMGLPLSAVKMQTQTKWA